MPFRIPTVMIFAFAVLVAGIVLPGVKSRGIRFTPLKAAALAFAVGVGIYSRSLASIFLLGPLSLVWFPETWGDYTGFFQGQYIDQKTPPVLVSIMGWLMLVGFPLLFWWVGLH
jgi:hypothetical protein